MITLENGSQTPAAQARIDHVNLVEQPLDTDVFRIFCDGLIIHRRAGHTEELALFSHAQFGMRFFHQLDAIPHSPSCLDFFVRKSISTACCPIFA